MGVFGAAMTGPGLSERGVDQGEALEFVKRGRILSTLVAGT